MHPRGTLRTPSHSRRVLVIEVHLFDGDHHFRPRFLAAFAVILVDDGRDFVQGVDDHFLQFAQDAHALLDRLGGPDRGGCAHFAARGWQSLRRLLRPHCRTARRWPGLMKGMAVRGWPLLVCVARSCASPLPFCVDAMLSVVSFLFSQQLKCAQTAAAAAASKRANGRRLQQQRTLIFRLLDQFQARRPLQRRNRS